ncbi:hypothetical protein C8R44DRAFT_778903 [Mycena epipterygia]|nr:hypothetical protein C8R44DRAFT_778903 [Mycena epipterygia]
MFLSFFLWPSVQVGVLQKVSQKLIRFSSSHDIPRWELGIFTLLLSYDRIGLFQYSIACHFYRATAEHWWRHIISIR